MKQSKRSLIALSILLGVFLNGSIILSKTVLNSSIVTKSSSPSILELKDNLIAGPVDPEPKGNVTKTI